MNKDKYMDGLDVLGAATDSGRAVLIKVKNVPELVAKQGGATGSFAQMIIPGTIEAKVYDTIRAQLKTKLGEQGVDADVQVVAPAGMVPAGASPIWRPLAIGAGSILALLAGRFLWRKVRG